jgi:hypothetical protein
MVRLVQVQFAMPTIWFAVKQFATTPIWFAAPGSVCSLSPWAVDASATRANKISEDREKEQSRRPDGSRHLWRCECSLEFSILMVFIIIFGFYLLALTVHWISQIPLCNSKTRESVQQPCASSGGFPVGDFPDTRYYERRILTSSTPVRLGISCSVIRRW